MRVSTRLLTLSVLLALSACTRAVRPSSPEVPPRERAPEATVESPPSSGPRAFARGKASYYGQGFQGRLTANGERFNRHGFTAAHRSLRFGSCVIVENLANGRRAKVRVNDRGPYVSGRIVDVSEGAARKLGMLDQGVTDVRLYHCDG